MKKLMFSSLLVNNAFATILVHSRTSGIMAGPPGGCPNHPDYKLYGKNCDQLCLPMDNTDCNNNGACVTVDETNIKDVIGAAPLQDITYMCLCDSGYMGQRCTKTEEEIKDNLNCNKGNFTSDNFITGCDCHGTNSHGWHCDIKDVELCPRKFLKLATRLCYIAYVVFSWTN